MNEQKPFDPLEVVLEADQKQTLNVLTEQCHGNAVTHGFYDDELSRSERVKNLLLNQHGECSELWEAVRRGEEHQLSKDHPECGLTAIEEEIADMFIRLFDFAGFMGVDTGRAVLAKMKFNTSRPYRHGGKKA